VRDAALDRVQAEPTGRRKSIGAGGFRRERACRRAENAPLRELLETPAANQRGAAHLAGCAQFNQGADGSGVSSAKRNNLLIVDNARKR